MFDTLDLLPADPILGLGQQYVLDDNPDKVGLSVGVYQNEMGETPILRAVRLAEAALINDQVSKSYIPQAGDTQFLMGITELVLGPQLAGNEGRTSAVQTPGGCGAIRIAAEVINASQPGARIWVSDPTWANHYPLLSAAGLNIETYPYYDPHASTLKFEAMLACLKTGRPGDVVLLHASCHNPTGAELTTGQWDEIIDVLAEGRLMPFIDSAYQGFGESLDADAYGIREVVRRLPEAVVATSCSKNFGLYRERTGAILFIAEDDERAAAAQSHALTIARRSYTMAPYHGAGIVGRILADPMLYGVWNTELAEMRNRINSMRRLLVAALVEARVPGDFEFIAEQRGMFSFLGTPEKVVHQLRELYGIYILDSTRINVAGLTKQNVEYVANAMAEVMRNG